MGGNDIRSSDVLFDEHPPGSSPLELDNGIVRQHSLFHMDSQSKELSADGD